MRVWNGFADKGAVDTARIARLEKEIAQWKYAQKVTVGHYNDLITRFEEVKAQKHQLEEEMQILRYDYRLSLEEKLENGGLCRDCSAAVFSVKNPALCPQCDADDVRLLVRQRYSVVLAQLQYQGRRAVMAGSAPNAIRTPKTVWSGVDPARHTLLEQKIYHQDRWVNEETLARLEMGLD